MHILPQIFLTVSETGDVPGLIGLSNGCLSPICLYLKSQVRFVRLNRCFSRKTEDLQVSLRQAQGEIAILYFW